MKTLLYPTDCHVLNRFILNCLVKCECLIYVCYNGITLDYPGLFNN